MRRFGRGWALAAGLGLLGGCGGGADGRAGGHEGGATALDAGSARTPPVGSGDEPGARDGGFCAGSGPVVLVPGAGAEERDRCTGAIAERVFGHALCTCEDLRVEGFLRTRSRDSAMPGGADDAAGAAVGVNGRYHSGSYTDVGGSLAIAGGGAALRFAGALDVRGDAAIASSMESAGYVAVARDARVAGDITLAGLLSVGRDLYQPAGRALAAVPAITGRRVAEAVHVVPPCECPATPIVDVPALVDAAARDHDGAAIGLHPDALSSVIGALRVELPCGRYYVRGIGGTGLLTLAVRGRVALFVDGDVRSLGVLDIDLAPGAELDVFVRGTLSGIGWGRFGGGDRPAAVRIYVGGSEDVVLTGAEGLVGNLHAPRARVVTTGAMFVDGAISTRAIDARGALTVRYDRAIRRVGDDCPDDPPGLCDRCDGSCEPGACVDGACSECGSDADCCAPLVCMSGRCQELLF